MIEIKSRIYVETILKNASIIIESKSLFSNNSIEEIEFTINNTLWKIKSIIYTTKNIETNKILNIYPRCFHGPHNIDELDITLYDMTNIITSNVLTEGSKNLILKKDKYMTTIYFNMIIMNKYIPHNLYSAILKSETDDLLKYEKDNNHKNSIKWLCSCFNC